MAFADTTSNRLAPFAQLLVISLLNGTAVYAVRPMASYRALGLGADALQLGFLATSYAVLALFAALSIGRWVDRFGSGRLLLAGSSLVSLSSLAPTFVSSIAGLAVTQACLGLGQTMSLIAAQTLVANHSARGRRDQRFGYYTVAASTGQLIGPAGAGLIAGMTTGGSGPTDPVPVFICAAALGVISFALGVRLSRTSRTTGSEPHEQPRNGRLVTARAVLKKTSVPPALFASVIVIVSLDVLVVYMPAVGAARGWSVEFVGMLLAIRAAGSMLSRLLLGKVIRILDRRTLLAGSLLISAVMLAVLVVSNQRIAAPAILLVMGVGLGLGGPITMSWIATQVGREMRGTALAVRVTCNRLAQFVVPSLLGGVATAVGLTGMFLFLAVMVALGSVAVLQAPFNDQASSAGDEVGAGH